jgi:hypothetical protein
VEKAITRERKRRRKRRKRKRRRDPSKGQIISSRRR